MVFSLALKVIIIIIIIVPLPISRGEVLLLLQKTKQVDV